MGDDQPAVRAAINEERVAEDAAVHDERQTADETLRREREETARVLRSLIPLERENTDRHLLTERALWDDAVANRDGFLGIVSHDLRGLLGGIVNTAAGLSLQAPDTTAGQHVAEDAHRIRRYAAHMNRLIGDLLDVASIEAGKLTVAPTLSDAAALLTDAADSFGPAASVKNIGIAVQVAERPLHAMFDYPRMLQVINNLLSNAVKFTAAGGQIVLRAKRTGSDLRISVGDTGLGIPDDQLERVFERFSQVAVGHRPGLGLGLYISRCIIDAHNGRVWAESPDMSGTTIYIELPQANQGQSLP
jgi:signal transduction histidine kinase